MGAPGRSRGAKNPQIPRLSTGVSGRRYYSPSQGRFLGRDPKGEAGGKHLYAFVTNNPTNAWDYLGMTEQMSAFVVNGGRREVRQEVDDDDGCLYEVTYQDMSSDPAYGFEDMQVVQRVKISCPMNPECDELRGKIANNEATLAGLRNRTSGSNSQGFDPRQFYDDNIRSKGQVSGWFGKGGQALYEAAKIGLDAAGQRKLRKALTALYKGGGVKVLGAADLAGNTADAVNLALDLDDRNPGELLADSADTLLGILNFTPGVNAAILGARISITVATNVWAGAVKEADRKSAERYERAVEENIQRGEQKLDEFRSRFDSLGCK